jgi:dihydrofolate reductase
MEALEQERRNDMARLTVFNSVTLDGYFTDPKGDMSWAHAGADDPEWTSFVADNASGGGVLLFGRITYDMMKSYWPTPQAAKDAPVVAEQMNKLPKVVFSRTMDKATWNNTKLVKGDIAEEVRKLKEDSRSGLVIMGSGSIVSQLAPHGVIDEYQIIVNPVVLGSGRTMFENLRKKLDMKLTKTRAFRNGKVLLCYAPAA